MTTDLVPIQLTYKQLYDLYGNGSHDEFQAVEEDIFIKTHTQEFASILGVICKHDQPIMRVDLSNSDAFECAEEHLFSCAGHSVMAINAVDIDLVDGSTVSILEKTPLGIEHVYDIAINAPHWYVADPDSGIIHHNTFFVMGIAKRWLDDHAEGHLIYYDTEAAVTKQMMADRGMDVSRIIIVESETIQKFRHNLLQILAGYMALPESERPPLLVVLDSLGMMSTTKEMEDTTEGKETKDMTKSGIIKATFRVLSLKLAKAGVSLFVTNHVYAAIGCLGESAKIRHSDGSMISIKDIRVGDTVETLEGIKPVTECFSYDVDEVFDITFADGITITATPNHKFLTTTRGWRRADDLNETDEICTFQL